jgi:hypothetical protein
MSKEIFQVDVKGIGTFEFKRRTIEDELAIQSRFHRIIGNAENLPEPLMFYAAAVAIFSVLLVKSPEFWSLDGLDPFEESSFQEIATVFTVFMEADLAHRNQHPAETEQHSLNLH